MLTITGLNKAFGARDLFVDAQLQVYARDRVAIVGPNGSGKTTLFEMIVGDQQPDSGEIRLIKDAIVGYLRQETDALRGRTLLDEVVSTGSLAAQVGHRLSVLEAEMAELDPGPERDRVVTEYGRLQDRYSSLGGYSLEFEAKRILGGLGFTTEDLARQTEHFSGGWLMRIALAKLLLANPDVLMLDEPTNHLDLESVVWLERFLRTYEGAVLLISHDRDLINALASKVVELRERKLYSYTGDYQHFVEARELELEQQEAVAKNQARKIAQTERFINRFRYKQSLASRVQSRVKMLEKIERVDAPSRSRKKMNLQFPEPPRSGRVVLELDDVEFGYNDKPVYENLELVLERGEKVALVGPNGAGKSTLLKLAAGALEPRAGERKLGHNVALGYFAQHQIEALTPTNSVMKELQQAVPPGANVDVRKLLGRFLFTGDDAEKSVSVLSGGERTRLALAKLLVSPVNLLCMDEPTNHLDMWSRDVLEEAMSEYSGTVVLITHDRHLIRNVADRIIEVVDGRVTNFIGDYDYYLSKSERPEIAPQRNSSRPATPEQRATGPKTKEQKRQEAEARAATKSLRTAVERIEKQLTKLDGELKELEQTFANPEVYMAGVDVAELTKRYESGKRRRTALEEKWGEAVQNLEAAEAAEA